MAMKTMSGRIRADLDLNRIVVELDRFGKPPLVRLEGEILTPSQPRVRLQSQAVITTRYLGTSGEQWINELRAAFAADHPERKESR